MKKIIAIALALVMCLSIMSMVAFAAAPTLNSLAIVGENIPGVPSWAPDAPEGDMTKVSDGVYEKILECPAGTNMNFKVAGNDKWDDTCNFGSATLVLGQKADLECSGGSGNMNLTFDKATKIKITVDVTPMNSDGAATILVEEVTAGGTQPTQPTQPTTKPTTGSTNGKYTLTVKVPADWTTVNVYTWTDGDNKVEAFGTYPGSAMQKSGDVYKCEIDGNVKNLIISNQNAQKTDDLKVESGKNINITVAADGKATITYPGSSSSSNNRKPAAAAPQGTLSNFRVVGNTAWLGNWDAAFEGGRMIQIEPGLYRKNFENVEPGSYEIKITKDGKWGGDYGDNGSNYCFTVDQKGTITVDFKLNGEVGIISVYGLGVDMPGTADISMISVVVLMALASVTAVVLVVNKKKFI